MIGTDLGEDVNGDETDVAAPRHPVRMRPPRVPAMRPAFRRAGRPCRVARKIAASIAAAAHAHAVRRRA